MFLCLKLKERVISNIPCRCVSNECLAGCTVFLCFPCARYRELMNSHLGPNPEDLQLEDQAGERFIYQSQGSRAHSFLPYYDVFVIMMLLRLDKTNFIFSAPNH